MDFPREGFRYEYSFDNNKKISFTCTALKEDWPLKLLNKYKSQHTSIKITYLWTMSGCKHSISHYIRPWCLAFIDLSYIWMWLCFSKKNGPRFNSWTVQKICDISFLKICQHSIKTRNEQTKLTVNVICPIYFVFSIDVCSKNIYATSSRFRFNASLNPT